MVCFYNAIMVLIFLCNFLKNIKEEGKKISRYKYIHYLGKLQWMFLIHIERFLYIMFLFLFHNRLSNFLPF